MADRNQLSKPHQPRAQWRTRMGFILAALGSAVGLGNIWRFSYLCYKNGGGAFLIPYVIALFVVGIPLMILELGLGHKMRGSAPMSFARFSRDWEWVGWWSVNCAMYGIMLYYSAVIAWCVSYTFFSTNLAWGTDPNDFFFHQYLHLSSGPGKLGDIQTPIIFSLLAVWFICWFIVFFGVQKGVERANKIFMPLLFGLMAVLVVWGLSLPGARQGLAVYLRPDFAKLREWGVWIDAFTQIFFTLSLSFGIMITYASYLPRRADIVRDAYIVSIGNCLFSFFAGLAVFGTLGYMSVTTQQPIGAVVKESIGLAFVTYPQAISLMPAFARTFGVLFFASLVIAGLSSAVSLVEAFSSAVIDKFHYDRRNVVSAVCVSGFLGSVVFTAQSGLFWVDIVDHFITHYGLVIVGLLECFLIGWLFKASRLREHINQHRERTGASRLTRWWDFAVRYLTPSVLLVLLTNDIVKEIATPYEGYPWTALIGIGHHWLGIALIVALFVSMRPWRRDLHAPESGE